MAGVSILLIIIGIVLSILIGIISLLFLVAYSHPDDRNQAWLPKIIVLLSLYFTITTVILPAYDVANGTSGGINISLLWQIILIGQFTFLIGVLPFAYFYYESDEVNVKDGVVFCSVKQWWGGFKMTFATIIVFGGIMAIMFVTIGYAEIPCDFYASYPDAITTQDPALLEAYLLSPTTCTAAKTSSSQVITDCTYTNLTLQNRVTFPMYIIAFMSFIGWFFFILYGGIGLFSLPWGLVNKFRRRPIRMTRAAIEQEKRAMGDRAIALAQVGKSMKENGEFKSGKWNNKQKKTFNEWKLMVQSLEEDMERMKCVLDHELFDKSIVWFVLYLVSGVIFMCISLAWLIHIVLFVFLSPPITTFLNKLFIYLDGIFPLFGTLAYGIFAFYLLMCVMAGSTKFSERFPIFTAYPFLVDKTPMNAFLINCFVFALCSVSVIQFNQTCFSVYLASTQVSIIFGAQVLNLKFFRYFFATYAFIYSFFGFAILSFIFMAVFPGSRPDEAQMLKELRLSKEAKRLK